MGLLKKFLAKMMLRRISNKHQIAITPNVMKNIERMLASGGRKTPKDLKPDVDRFIDRAFNENGEITQKNISKFLKAIDKPSNSRK